MNKKESINFYIKKALKENKNFFCISHYKNDIGWVRNIKKENLVIYNKGGAKIKGNINYINVKNVGYNLYSYLEFIIKNYEDLPEIIVFCKDNVFTKHIKKEKFIKLINRKVFTNLEDNNQKRRFPIYIGSSDNSYNEINNSWYKYNYPRLYFSDFNQYFKYIFKNSVPPDSNNFAPGANYIVPKSHILMRSKNFYSNLKKFISHDQFSCESHFLERSLVAIWNPNIESNDIMNDLITPEELKKLKIKCLINKKLEKKYLEKFKRKINHLPLMIIEIFFKFIK